MYSITILFKMFILRKYFLFIVWNKWIENWLWNRNFNPIYVFDDVGNKLVSTLHCTVMMNILAVTYRWKSQMMYISNLAS